MPGKPADITFLNLKKTDAPVGDSGINYMRVAERKDQLGVKFFLYLHIRRNFLQQRHAHMSPKHSKRVCGGENHASSLELAVLSHIGMVQR